jgi:hypothetical protein
MLEVPCRDCDRRTVGCHNACSVYRLYREERELIREIRKKRLVAIQMEFDERIKNIRRSKRK